MNFLIVFVVLAFVAQNEWAIARVLNEVHPDPRFMLQTTSSLDCTQFINDWEILSSFPFVTSVDPLTSDTTMTYAEMNADGYVYYLNIVDQKFLPNTVFCLKYLQQLYVRNTSFANYELSADIERLAETLTHLALSDQPIIHLPDQFGKLTRLVRLELYNISLVDLPNSFGDLSSLQSLYMFYSKLTSLPTTFANLRSLTYLVLYGNTNLHLIESLNGLPNLTKLNIQDCPIERLPLNLPNLYSLYMANSTVTNLIGIATLGNNTSTSKSFSFYNNRIQFVPPEIRSVRNLFQLGLNFNQLITLPSDIYNITTLQYLDIRNNRFSNTELRAIVAKFNATNPLLHLQW